MNTINHVREYRKNSKLSQEQLAAIAGVPRTNLSEIENGRRRPRIDTCQAIAKALNTTVSDLWPEDDAA